MLRVLLSLAVTATTGLCASLQQVTNFGENPTNIRMYMYVPDKLSADPAIIVNLHGCGGTARQWFSGTSLPASADTHGFILIYPETPNMMNCWDVHNAASLTHGKGGDALGIVNMVKHARTLHGGTQTFVTGFSSGGMMTNVLAGSYPDVFEAGAAFSGTPFACFAGAPQATPIAANQTCAQGMTHTAEEWGAFVRNAYPGYDGPRPRMQIYHGLADNLVRPQCAAEALKQWSNVLGVEFARNASGVPASGYTQMIYGDGSKLEGFFAQGVGHGVPYQTDSVLRFFGLIQ